MSAPRQRGVALLAAILVVALATVLIASLLDRSQATLARTRNSLRASQGWELMRGAEGWAGAILLQDASQAPGIDSREDAWAQGMPPIDLPGVRIFGQLREQGGCFNLNSLHPGDADDADAIARFERLLRALRLDPAIAEQAADWIDADAIPRSRGAEDSAYLARQPPYRAANQPFAHVSELRLLPGVTAEAYAVLAPETCALPAGVPINLNFASPALWMSLADGVTPSMAERLARDGRANYASIEEVQRELTQLGLPPMPLAGYGVGTEWFVLEVQIVADGIPFAYSSLLHRRPGRIDVVARARGRL